LATACAVLAPGVALADDSAVAQADKLFQQGRKAAERGDYAEACLRFEDSYRLDPGVGTVVNLGDCEEHLGELQRARDYYRTALSRMNPGDDRIPHLRERLAGIERSAARLTLRLAKEAPDGTVVTVDGTVVDPHRAPLLLAKGVHPILVTAVGYRGARYSVGMAEGEARELDVSPGAPLETILPGQPAPDASPPRGSWMKPIGITSLGVGVGSLWVGSLAGLEAIDRRDVQRANCDAQNLCNADGVAAAHDGATWAAVSTATFVVGGVLFATGVALLVWSVVSGRAPAPALSSLVLSPSGVGGSF
jgi:hypothetical protein